MLLFILYFLIIRYHKGSFLISFARFRLFMRFLTKFLFSIPNFIKFYSLFLADLAQIILLQF